MVPLSIIIPVYNVEKYIRECLESCVSQSLKGIEIIIVNDRTPDNSIKKIKDLVDKNKNVRLINHRVNKGHGGALNTGIAAAKGCYVWCVDSDDFIDSHSCEFLYNYAKKNDLDALGFGACNFIVEDNVRNFLDVNKYSYTSFVCGPVYNGKTFIREAYCRYHRLNTPQWAYVFKREAISDYKFRENVSFEDNDGTPALLRVMDRISVLKYSPYYRRLHETNSVQYQSELDAAKVWKTIEQRLDIISGLIRQIKENRLKATDPLVFFSLRTFNTEIKRQYLSLSHKFGISDHKERFKALKKELYSLTKFRQIFFYRLFFALGVPAVYRQRWVNKQGLIRKIKYVITRILRRR